MQKEKNGDILTFYDVPVSASDGGEILRIEDQDITKDYWFDGLCMPYQYGSVEWISGDGFFTMRGYISKSYNMTFQIYKLSEDHA